MNSNSVSKSAPALLRSTSALCCCVLVFALPARLAAQTAIFAGIQTTLLSGWSAPQGVALDGRGNVYIAVPSANSVIELHADGSPQTTVGAGLLTPSAVTVDAAGDVLIADSGNNRILVVPSCACAEYDVPANNLKNPTGVAVDRNNNVFIADTGNGRVIEVNLAGGAETAINATVVNPEGIASDGANHLYISNYYNGQVLKVTLFNGMPTGTVVFSSAFAQPRGLAVDNQGNVFVADTYWNSVSEIPAAGGTPAVLGTGFKTPYGVAVDTAGDVFVADTGNNRAVEVETQSVNFGAVNVCPNGQSTPSPCSQTLTLNYNVTSPANLVVHGVFTAGAPNLDFTLATSGNCGYVTTGATCTANVTFTPLHAGPRLGAIQISDTLGDLLATTNLRGIGAGPQIAFNPSTQTTVGTGISYPDGIAMDGAGDVFIADFYNMDVVKVPAGGGAQTTVGSGLRYPTSLAVDGVGDVFIADPSNARIVELPAGGGAQTTVGTGFEAPVGVAVDGARNLFVADGSMNNVVEVPAGGGPQITIASGLNDPTRLAVDGTGNVFIVDGGNKRVVAAPAGGGALTVIATGLNQPSGVAVDAAGDVFIADGGNDNVVEIPAGGGAQTTVGTGFFGPEGVYVSSTGDVYIADVLGHQVLRLPRSQPPSLTFAATPFATTSTDSPMNVAVQNIGNRPLKITDVNYPVDFPVDFDEDGSEDLCLGSNSLEPGQVCYLAVDFEPLHLGALNENLTITDNTLNATGALQSIALSGTSVSGPFVSLSAVSLSFGTEMVGSTTASQSVTLTNTGNATLSITGIAVTGSGASSFGFANSCGTSLAAGASCLIHGHFAPVAAGALTAAVTITDNANGSQQTITLTGTGGAPPAVSLSATSVAFGSQLVGTTSASQSVTLTNTGGEQLSVTGIAVTGADSSSYMFSSSCGTSVAPGASCTIHGHFTPATAGALTAAVTITDNAGGSPQSIALTGTGVTPPAVTFSATSVTFGTQNVGTTSASQSVTLTNTGGSKLVITSIAVTGADATSFIFANSCGTSVAAGANCTIHGHFTPAAAGALSAAVTITDNASGSPQTITLTGTGH